jgi:hypothetical protein
VCFLREERERVVYVQLEKAIKEPQAVFLPKVTQVSLNLSADQTLIGETGASTRTIVELMPFLIL